MDKKYGWRDFSLILIFFSIIGLFMAAMVIKGDDEYSPEEKRYLTEISDVMDKSFLEGTLQTELESYLSDQLPARNLLLCAESFGRLSLGGDDQDVYLGEAGFMIQKITEASVGEQLIENEEALSEFIKFCDGEKSVKEVRVMVIPTKSLILKDYLPKGAPVYDQSAVLLHMEELWKDNFINLTKAFSSDEEVPVEELFYKTDHHWTMVGALAAAKEYLESIDFCDEAEKLNEVLLDRENRLVAVSDEFRGTLYSSTLYPLSDYDSLLSYPEGGKHRLTTESTTKNSLYSDEALLSEDAYSYYLGGNAPWCKIKGNDDYEQNLLIIKDSYANCFVPFLADSFKSIFMIDLRYYHEDVKEFMSENDIDHVLVLYNADNFLTDTNLVQLPGLKDNDNEASQKPDAGKAREYMDKLIAALNESDPDNTIDTVVSTGDDKYDNNINYLYQIDEELVEDGCFAYASDGLVADEISIVKPADGSAARIKRALNTRITRRQDDFRAYVPEEAEKIGNGLVFEKDGYVFLVITDNPSETEELIKRILEGE